MQKVDMTLYDVTQEREAVSRWIEVNREEAEKLWRCGTSVIIGDQLCLAAVYSDESDDS